MRNILFIVPLSRIRVLSKESFMLAISVDEDLTSSPIASVIYSSPRRHLISTPSPSIVGNRRGKKSIPPSTF